MRGELPVGLPVRTRLGGQPHLFKDHRQIEMSIGVRWIEAERLTVARLGFRVPSKIVIDVAEVEVRLEKIGLEADRALV